MTLVNIFGSWPTVLLLLLLFSHSQLVLPAAAGESIFDNIINQLMSTAATAQNYLDTVGQQPNEAEDVTTAYVRISNSFTDNGVPTTSTTFTSTTGSQNTPFWNPFTWLQPRAVSIPYNPDTDLSTVSTLFYFRL